VLAEGYHTPVWRLGLPHDHLRLFRATIASDLIDAVIRYAAPELFLLPESEVANPRVPRCFRLDALGAVKLRELVFGLPELANH